MTDKDDDKDQSLREDIRRLGRLLGDTVRNQHGDDAFDLIERVRQNSIRFRRDADQAARVELESTLNTLTNDQTTQVIRAFSYFSHLVNLAEDQHHIRRSRAHQIAGSAPRQGSLAFTIDALYNTGHSTQQLLDFLSMRRWHRC
jgi:phosphoenolpyruvate carboxylase